MEQINIELNNKREYEQKINLKYRNKLMTY